MTERHGNYDDLFQVLESYIGKEITCIYAEILSDEYKGVKSKLKLVHPYESITMELGDTYDFIGERNAIVVLAAEENGKIQYLYKNTNIEKKYPGYFKDPFGLISAQKEHLGYSVKEEKVNAMPTVKNSVK